jgi:uncharacterized membrane protein YkvA (DUF1232 family)
MTDYSQYRSKYSDEGFWRTVKKAGKRVFEPALTLWCVLKSEETPAAAKALILGALGYLVCPLDLIPDLVPVLGFTDDLAALLAVLKTVGDHVTEDVRKEVFRRMGD